MIGPGERKAAPEGANHHEIGPAGDNPNMILSPARIMGVDLCPSHLPEFRVAAINRAFISYSGG